MCTYNLTQAMESDNAHASAEQRTQLFMDLPRMWYAQGEIAYIVWQLEKGASGNLHLQIYLVLKENPSNKNGRSLTWVKNNINAKMNIELCKGTHEQCRAYCMKQDTRQSGPWELGEYTDGRAVQGSAVAAMGRATQKASLEEVKDAILKGATDDELWLRFFGVMLRHQKALNSFRLSIRAKERDWQTNLLVLYGPPGTGKSHTAKTICKKHGGGFWLRKPKDHGTDWWDGYDGQPVVVLDEYYGWLPFDSLCRLVDKNPYQVETKGSMIPFTSKLVVITSNVPPREWYSEEAINAARWAALVRRMSGSIGTVRHMTTVVQVDDDNNSNFDDRVDAMIAGAIDLDGIEIAEELEAVPHHLQPVDQTLLPDDDWENSAPTDDIGYDDNYNDDSPYAENLDGYQEYEQERGVTLGARNYIDITQEGKVEPCPIHGILSYFTHYRRRTIYNTSGV